MNIQIDPNTPVIIGKGQVQYDSPADLSQALGPVDVIAEAVQAALLDSQISDIGEIDRLTSIRLFADSGPVFPSPFGKSENLPKAVAMKTGLTPETLLYSPVGGDQPQTQIMETAKALYQGESSFAVVCGGEAIANMKAALRAGVSLDWSDELGNDDLKDEGPFPDGLILSPEELRHGLMQPVQFYALAETAQRLSLDMSLSDYQARAGEILAPFSKIASENPYSISNARLSAQDIATPSDKNKILAEPYTKAMVAKDGVNQGAAIIMTTFAKAKRLGLDETRFIYLTGFAKAQDGFLSERADISNSVALKLAIQGALCSAGLQTSDIHHADIYSCFPIVIERARDLLKEADLHALTLTGGLPFFGGPGNNYSLHAIAEMVAALRVDKQKTDKNRRGLVFANGGFITKHSVGIYSTHAPDYNVFDRCVDFTETMKEAPVYQIESHYEGGASLLSYALSYKSGHPHSAVIIADIQDTHIQNTQRVLARFEGPVERLSPLKKGHKLYITSTPKGHVARLGN